MLILLRYVFLHWRLKFFHVSCGWLGSQWFSVNFCWNLTSTKFIVCDIYAFFDRELFCFPSYLTSPQCYRNAPSSPHFHVTLTPQGTWRYDRSDVQLQGLSSAVLFSLNAFSLLTETKSSIRLAVLNTAHNLSISKLWFLKCDLLDAKSSWRDQSYCSCTFQC